MTPPTVAAVEIASDDGVILRGQLWPRGPAWVVLLHEPEPEADLDRWAPLAAALAAREWTVLTIDLRGHGASDGAWDPALAGVDLAALAAFVRDRGARCVAVGAAGASATTALTGAGSLRPDALVLLSPPVAAEQPLAGERGAGEAKLYVVGGGDPAMRAGAERLVKASIGWSLLVNLPTAAQGTALLVDASGPHLTEHVAGFLAEQRWLAGNRTRQREAAGASDAGASVPAAADVAETTPRQRSDRE